MINEFNLLKQLTNYYLEYGILTSNGMKTLDVKFLDSNNKEVKKSYTIAEIMYFIEYGTFDIPGYFVFNKTNNHINYLIDEKYNYLIDKIMKKEIININQIEQKLNELCLSIQNYIATYIYNIPNKNNILNKLLGLDDNVKSIYDLQEISKFVSCSFKKI